MNWKASLLAVAAVAAVTAGGLQLMGTRPLGSAATHTSGGQIVGATTQNAPVGAPGATALVAQPSTAAPTARAAQVGAVQAAPLSAPARAALQEFERLRDLPAGDAAIALGRQMEAAISAENVRGYVQALLSTTSPAVERSAGSALARFADGDTLRALAAEYGNVAPENRGRILQVLEQAANPAAVEGLASLFAADASEKRSPVVMSALYGIAHIGNMESVQYLLQQITPTNADFALMALERVHSPQGLEMIRAAAEGSKDAQGIPAAYLPALQRIADAGGKS